MSRVWICTDWHLGHKSIKRWESNGLDINERTGRLLENYCSVVNKRDVVWFLGDICFDLESIAVVSKLVGDKRIILGNHDTDRKVPIEQFILCFDQVHGLVSYKDAWLSHPPIHPVELRGKFNIHGHVHQHSVMKDVEVETCLGMMQSRELDARYFNACPEVNNYTPVLYQEIIARLRGKENNSSSGTGQGGLS